MTIHLISFASILHKQVSLRSSHEAILSEIEKYYTVKFVDHQDMDKLSSDDFKIIFVATGGDRKSTRLNSSHANESRMPSSA